MPRHVVRRIDRRVVPYHRAGLGVAVSGARFYNRNRAVINRAAGKVYALGKRALKSYSKRSNKKRKSSGTARRLYGPPVSQINKSRTSIRRKMPRRSKYVKFTSPPNIRKWLDNVGEFNCASGKQIAVAHAQYLFTHDDLIDMWETYIEKQMIGAPASTGTAHTHPVYLGNWSAKLFIQSGTLTFKLHNQSNIAQEVTLIDITPKKDI